MAFLVKYLIGCDHKDCKNEIAVQARTQASAALDIQVNHNWVIKYYRHSSFNFVTYCPDHKTDEPE